jgi:hypothetical protein
MIQGRKNLNNGASALVRKSRMSVIAKIYRIDGVFEARQGNQGKPTHDIPKALNPVGQME